MKKWKLGLCLLLLFLVISPVFSQDTGYVKVEVQDWEKIQLYYQTSQKELKELSNELENLQSSLEKSKTDLMTSLNQVETLKISFSNMQNSLKKTQSWNKVLIGTVIVSLSLNVLFIVLLTR